ncbi:MAG: phage holin family protein [Candidatus Sulfobium sp.]|jgi:putative membrane protein
MAFRTADRARLKNFFIRWLINTIAIMVAVELVPGIVYSGGWWGILIVGAIFGLVNAYIKPFIQLFTLPFLVLTLGLFTFIINAMMLGITSWLSSLFSLGFSVAGFKPAFLGALIVSFISMFLTCLTPPEKKGFYL